MPFTNYHEEGYKSLLSDEALWYLHLHTGYLCTYCGQTTEDCIRFGCEDC